jgi:hypothetical protein
MIQLRDKDTGDLIGSVNEEQLQFLIDQLEEESETDRDYYIDGPTLELLQGNGADDALISMLKQALGSRSEMEIEWSRT